MTLLECASFVLPVVIIPERYDKACFPGLAARVREWTYEIYFHA